MSDTISRQAAIDVLEERLRANGYSNVALVSELNRSIGYLMRLPSATSQSLTKPNKSDLISRQAAIDAVMGFMPSLTTPDGCGQFDREIFEAQEMFVDIGQALNKLPSAQPFTAEQIQTMQELEFAQVEKAYELGKADRPKGHWIETAQAYYEMINEKGGGVDENTPYFIDDIACSECLAKFSVIDNETERFDFCPNCGCLMKGADDE